MAVEAISNYNDFFNCMVYETLNVTQYGSNIGTMENDAVLQNTQNPNGGYTSCSGGLSQGHFPTRARANGKANLGVQGRKKRRRRRAKVCKNKEEAETQRMTHIAVERNRRKQMNEHLAVLRSLMPESYSLRGDQASIVGGAIEYLKELEQLVHSLEARKLLCLQQAEIMRMGNEDSPSTSHNDTLITPSFPAAIYSDPQQIVSQNCNKFTLKSKTATAYIEVTLIETHANLRILAKKNPRQLSRLVSGLHTLRLTILHLNVTSFDPSLVLYTISVKVEEGCQLTSVDSIAGALHHLLRIIEEEVASLLLNY